MRTADKNRAAKRAAALCLVVTVLFALAGCGGSGGKGASDPSAPADNILWEAFRQIKVFDLVGSASVERDGVGTLEPYIDMMLESGDDAEVSELSYMELKMDEDKYAHVEQQTRFSIEALGHGDDTKTVIRLEEGSIINSVRSPLSDASEYRVTTPNATMTVRGTIFWVSFFVNAQGVDITQVDVYQGEVELTPLDDAGDPLPDQAVLVKSGDYANCHAGDTLLSEGGSSLDRLTYEGARFVERELNGPSDDDDLVHITLNSDNFMDYFELYRTPYFDDEEDKDTYGSFMMVTYLRLKPEYESRLVEDDTRIWVDLNVQYTTGQVYINKQEQTWELVSAGDPDAPDSYTEQEDYSVQEITYHAADGTEEEFHGISLSWDSVLFWYDDPRSEGEYDIKTACAAEAVSVGGENGSWNRLTLTP